MLTLKFIFSFILLLKTYAKFNSNRVSRLVQILQNLLYYQCYERISSKTFRFFAQLPARKSLSIIGTFNHYASPANFFIFQPHLMGKMIHKKNGNK